MAGDIARAAGAADQTDEDAAIEDERRHWLEPTFAVAGKRVTLRARIPLREGRHINGLLNAVQSGDLETYLPVLMLLIESWQFDGDPHDPAAYADLDTSSEIMPLAFQVVRRWNVRAFAANPKAYATTSARLFSAP